MKTKPVLFIFIFLFLLLSLIACGSTESSDVKNDIIGKWVSDDDKLTLEFTADQKIHSIYDGGNFTNSMEGDVSWLGDNVLVGMWEINIATWEVRIWGDKMELKSNDGRKITMHRTE